MTDWMLALLILFAVAQVATNVGMIFSLRHLRERIVSHDARLDAYSRRLAAAERALWGGPMRPVSEG
jgi:hypothetical protein